MPPRPAIQLLAYQEAWRIANMTAIGSLVFCTACGNLLEGSSGDKKAVLTCEVCGTENKGQTSSSASECKAYSYFFVDTASTSITTTSKPSAFPSVLRAKKSAVQKLTAEDTQTTAKIKMTCRVCGREEMNWYTQQLRSADEGTTVFYVCECGYRFASDILMDCRALDCN